MISVCLIVKNEEKYLRDCLESLKKIEEDYEVIIALDTKTTDNSKEICLEYGCKIYDYEWQDHFAKARNFAISKAKGDWIFTIDGDMTLERFEQPDNEYDYYICSMGVDTTLKQRLYFPLILLFKNRFRYSGKRHSTVDKSVIGYKGKMSNIMLFHPIISKRELNKKIKHNLEIHLWQLKNEPDNITNNYNLCRCYYYLKQFDKCIEYGTKALNDPVNAQLKAEIGILTGLSFVNLGFKEDGIIFLMTSIMYLPMQVMSRLLMAELLKSINQLDLANEQLKQAEKINNNKNSQLPCEYYFENFKQFIN